MKHNLWKSGPKKVLNFCVRKASEASNDGYFCNPKKLTIFAPKSKNNNIGKK